DGGAVSSTLGWRRRAWWVLLAFAPSSLLLGVTSYLSTDVAVVPLLWVVPLALYLLTFVLVFARRPPVPRELMLRLHPLIFLPLVVAMFVGRGGSVRLMAPWHLLLFFVTAMVCHGELARLRPAASRLTEFYLWLSVGGVLGGAFNVLLAPLLFDRVLEYPLVLVLACALRPWPAAWRDGGGRRPLLLDVALPVALGAALLGVLRWPGPWHPLVSSYVVPVVGGVGALACLFFVPRPLRYALGVLALLVAGVAGGAAGRPPMMAARSFFGAYTVRVTSSGFHELYHGSTLHGVHRVGAAGDGAGREPLSYYGLRGPLGDIVGAARLAGRPLRIGVVGLGTGTVACYTRPGDTIAFYEIDPLVVTIAHDSRLFTYLADCAPDARMVLGDARLSLARDSAALYDVLVLDAFSSDAIPVHLLTREALRVYLARLAPDGVLAVHISNRYLNLRPAVAALAADAGAVALLGENRRLTAEDRARMHTPSVWVAVARRAGVLAPLDMRSRWQPLEAPAGARVWTDDYSNVLGALVW
ncbi:MAG: spermidine synthase, partial [Gemmatimonadaceae bacterium]